MHFCGYTQMVLLPRQVPLLSQKGTPMVVRVLAARYRRLLAFILKSMASGDVSSGYILVIQQEEMFRHGAQMKIRERQRESEREREREEIEWLRE